LLELVEGGLPLMVVMSSSSNVDLLEIIDVEQGLMSSSVQKQEEPVLKISIAR
jgi:hypothetical protein